MSPCSSWCSAELAALHEELGGAAESCYYRHLLGVEVATRCLTAVEVKKKKKKPKRPPLSATAKILILVLHLGPSMRKEHLNTISKIFFKINL